MWLSKFAACSLLTSSKLTLEGDRLSAVAAEGEAPREAASSATSAASPREFSMTVSTYWDRERIGLGRRERLHTYMTSSEIGGGGGWSPKKQTHKQRLREFHSINQVSNADRGSSKNRNVICLWVPKGKEKAR